MLGVAIGGAFLDGHVLVIQARYVEVEEPIDKAQPYRPVHGLSVELPSGVKLTVNRWAKHLDLTIHMRAQAGGQDGHCGNFNGDAADDTVDLIKARMELRVSREDLLFPKAGPRGDDT